MLWRRCTVLRARGTRARLARTIMRAHDGPARVVFWRSSGTQNGSCTAYRRKALDVLFPTDIKFARIGVRTRELWLPEVGVSELFSCTFPVKIPIKRGMLIGEPRVPRRSRSHYLSNAPGLADQLVASRKDSAREGGCSGFAGIRAWTCEIWPREQRSTGVFLVRLRAVFRSGFRLTPINSWRSESSTSCMDVSSFQCARARRSTCCESGRLCAQAWQRRWENSGTFSTALFRRPVFTRVVDVAPDVGFRRSWYRRKACATYFSKRYRPCTEASLGSQDMILRTEAVGMFLMPRAEVNLLPKGLGSWTKLQRVGENLCANVASQIGCFVNNTYQNLAKCSDRFFAVLATTLSFLVRFRPVKYGIEALDILYTLVKGWSVRFQFLVWSMVRSNLGQTLVKPWSNLVEFGQKLSKLLEMYPGPHFKGFWARWDPSRVGNGSVKPSAGLVRAALVLRADTRENPGAYLGGNVCAKILSDPLQLGPRAKTLRQEVHFSYHTQLSDRQELLRSSRNLSQKMTPWHKEHSDGLRSQGSYLANPSSPLCKACTFGKSLPDSQQVDPASPGALERRHIHARRGTLGSPRIYRVKPES
uniref:Uncharacterized protein n=1 Tax=Fagus sylvatica TaxID=28930 RepID=A0A2N9IH77_FAGSY